MRAPIVDLVQAREIVPGVWVIPDLNHTPLVPNVGIIVGSRATLIVDTGFGAKNALSVFEHAQRFSGRRPIFVTHTHCHPEHGFGANAIEKATTVRNQSQWEELEEKGPLLLQMFRKQIPALASMLEGVEFVRPHMLYSGSMTLDLGGLVVELREFGGGHSRGDQAILVRASLTILFTGDLVEEGTFGILGDNESHVLPWIDRLEELERIRPDFVVPGHGHLGGQELIATYLAYMKTALRRVRELRSSELSEAEIIDKVGAELIALHPEWSNETWAEKTGEDLRWPARE
jgi:glyoxylase-like metal-dependent hydrolase (beta-lactamase superfamily II)